MQTDSAMLDTTTHIHAMSKCLANGKSPFSWMRAFFIVPSLFMTIPMSSSTTRHPIPTSMNPAMDISDILSIMKTLSIPTHSSLGTAFTTNLSTIPETTTVTDLHTLNPTPTRSYLGATFTVSVGENNRLTFSPEAIFGVLFMEM
ncbi:hypothetical protein BD779DRAFT_1557222 [Infundibulicybe gibba]|nr:hypothetical protein BD779DRAFT_1557222 [Infundibulicybe gibba]